MRIVKRYHFQNNKIIIIIIQNPTFVLENDTPKPLGDFGIHTDSLISAK